MTEREMFDRLRAGRSLEKFVAAIGSKSTTAFWSMYERGMRPLSVAQKNELRAAVGEELILDLSVEADRLIGVGATVVVGKQPFNLLIFSERSSGVIVLDSDDTHLEDKSVRPRGKIVRPVATVQQNEMRKALGVTWQDVIRSGLDMLKSERGG